MSDLLQNWLNNEVGLSTNVANFEKDFASGYLFGEVLHKFRQQDDFDHFVNKSTYEAKLGNFKRLEPTLKALGISVNATQSNAMMNGERGASLRLLYQLKMATERLLLACDGGAAVKLGQPHMLSAGAGVTKSLRVPRDMYDKHERRFFEHRLRATCPNVKQDRVDGVVRKFEEEKMKQEAIAFHMDSLEQAHVAEQREIHRFGLRERMRQNRAAKDEWTRGSYQLWEQNMQRKAQRESFDIDFANRAQKKQQDGVLRDRDAAAKDVRSGVEAFEKGLATLGLASVSREVRAVKADGVESDSSGDDDWPVEKLIEATASAATAREFVDSLKSRIPNAAELKQEADLFLQTIQESKRAGSIARKERERRRRRVLVEQQKEQDLIEESKLEEVLLEKLARQSMEEKTISYNVWKTQRAEEIIERNRRLRAQEYVARRKAEHAETLRRDRELGAEMIDTLREEEERERVRYRAIERGRRAAQRAKICEEVEGILDHVLDMTYATVDHQQVADTNQVNPTLWREWMALFVDGRSVNEVQEKSARVTYPVTALPPADPETVGPDATLNAAAMRDYVDGCGQWELSAISAGEGAVTTELAIFDPMAEAARIVADASVSIQDRLEGTIDLVATRPVNFRLGAIVAAMLDRLHREPPRPPPPPMPDVSLRLVVTGKPFAGKKAMAARLAEAYNLQVIDVEEVVHECLMLSKRPDKATAPIDVLSFTAESRDELCQTHEDLGNPYVRQLQQLGYEMQAALDRGEALTDEMYVSIVTAKIRSLFPDCIPKQEEPSGAADAPVAAVAEAESDPLADDAAASALVADPSTGATDVAADGAEPGAGDALVDAATAAEASAQEADNTTALAATDATNVTAEPALAPAASSVGEGLEDDEDSLKPAGWMLLGFPDDAARLQLFEHFLSGWVEPTSAPTPTAEIEKTKAALIVPAPPKEPPPFKLVPGGYDLHLRLEVPCDEVFRRALGQREDSATNLTYHLEDNPPLSKHQTIFERLGSAEKPSNPTGSLAVRTHKFDVSQPEVDYVLSFFGPFEDRQRLTSIDASVPADEVYDALDDQVASLLARRRADKAMAEEEARKTLEAAEEAKKLEEEAAAAAKAAAAQAAETGEAAPPAEPPPPDDGEPKPLPPLVPIKIEDIQPIAENVEDMAFHLLNAEWVALRDDYTSGTRQIFGWHRAHLSDFRGGLHGIQSRFVDFLQRPDDKQSLVDTFVQRFNSDSEEYPEMRKQDKTKEELHQRVDDLIDKLKSMVETSRTESLQHLEVTEQSGWVEAQVDVMVAQTVHAVRLEVRRYHSACQLITDFYSTAMGTGLTAERPLTVKIDVNAAEKKDEVPDPKAKAKAAPKKGQPEEVKEESVGTRKRRYVEAKKDEETGEVISPGQWEFPFLPDIISQAKTGLWEIADYTPPSAEGDGQDKDAGAKAKAKAKGKAAPAPDKKVEAEEVDTRAPPLFVDMQQALVAEQVTFLHRLAMLENWSHRRLLTVSTGVSEVFSQCRDWALVRRQKDLESIKDLESVLKEHIESDPPLLIKSRLTLDGAHLLRHPNTWLQPPQPVIVPEPIEAAAPFRWTIEQLDNLLSALGSSARSFGQNVGLVPSRCMHTILARLSQDYGDSVSLKEQGHVPAFWRGSGLASLHQLCNIFEHQPCVGSVDCVEFLLHICLLHSPLGWPSLPELMEVRKQLEPKAPKGCSWPDFWISTEDLTELPLFQDPQKKEEQFSKEHESVTAGEKTPFDRPREQRAWLGRLLSSFPAELQQFQTWELEVSWHDHMVRSAEDNERHAELFDDNHSTSSNTPRSPVDTLSPLLAPGIDASGPGLDGTEETGPRPLPPRPLQPANLPKRPEGGISVRQLLAFLACGRTSAEGVERALALLGPASGPVPAAAAHVALLQLGARPTPSSVQGDGRPSLPSLAQLCEVLAIDSNGSIQLADLVTKGKGVAALNHFGIASRHCRIQAEQLHPMSGPAPKTRAASRESS